MLLGTIITRVVVCPSPPPDGNFVLNGVWLLFFTDAARRRRAERCKLVRIHRCHCHRRRRTILPMRYRRPPCRDRNRRRRSQSYRAEVPGR